jgi:AbiV family abortive infection protein
MPSPAETVRAAQYAALDTARSQIDAARALYDQGRYPPACFLAMTAIEEMGKALVFQKADANEELPSPEELKGMRQHDPKAFVGALVPMVLNDEARERHGRNPVTKLDRIDAVRYLAEGGGWMPLHNACLYVDCDPGKRLLGRPSDEITREHAYLMIVGALEIFARLHAPGFTYHMLPADAASDDAKERATVAEITEFHQREKASVDLDRLDIIGSHEGVNRLRQAVRDKREATHNAILASRTPSTKPPAKKATAGRKKKRPE